MFNSKGNRKPTKRKYTPSAAAKAKKAEKALRPEKIAALEAKIERNLVAGVKALGGLSFKFTSPGATGVPDRIVIMPGGGVMFVELKTEYGRMATRQTYQLKRLNQVGANTRVLNGMTAVQEFLVELADAEKQ